MTELEMIISRIDEINSSIKEKEAELEKLTGGIKESKAELKKLKTRQLYIIADEEIAAAKAATAAKNDFLREQGLLPK